MRPLQRVDQTAEQRTLAQEGLVVEAGDVGPIAMMAQVQMADALERDISAAGDEAHQLPRQTVVLGARKQGVVCCFVNQISRDQHRVGGEQSAGCIRPPGSCSHQRESAEVAAHCVTKC